MFPTVSARSRRALVAVATAIAPLAYRKAWLRHRLTQYCRGDLALPDTAVIVALRPGAPADWQLVMLARERRRLRVACCPRILLRDPPGFFSRLSAALAIFTRVPATGLQAVADMSDGECSGPGIISFCSHDPGAILVPDLEFVWNRGYGDCRLHARANLTAWRARSDLIVWRGSTTGQGTVAKESLAADDASLLPRVRLCLRLREIPGTDAKISNVAQSDDRARYQQLLTRAGIMGEFISHMAWHSLKFAIDIDGNSNAWSNLFMRLLMGCCVLKVASPQGYRQWYYDDLKPWTHYVPIKADLSDLTAQIAWCRANMQACERIAAAGQAFAMAHSYETEVAAAAERVFAAFKQGTLRTTLP